MRDIRENIEHKRTSDTFCFEHLGQTQRGTKLNLISESNPSITALISILLSKCDIMGYDIFSIISPQIAHCRILNFIRPKDPPRSAGGLARTLFPNVYNQQQTT